MTRTRPAAIDLGRKTSKESVTPLAQILRMNGYSTAAFGKYHETAPWEVSVSGPYDRWPTGSGFDKFYGFIGGETNQWAPYLYDGVTQVELPADPKYHFMTDMTDRAVSWIRFQKAMTPEKPFFVYFAPGATHAPHHVPPEWIAKWTGKFDQGWDRLREETLARQIKLGVVPSGTKLAPKPSAIRDWDKLSAVPEAEQCGWLKDKFGVSWQVTPADLETMLNEGTPTQVARVTEAFLEMKKFDLARLRQVYEESAATAR